MSKTYIANCKINLGLHIVRKRPDGYHDLETVFYPTDFFTDKLTIESCNSDFDFECHSEWDTGPDDKNLCVKAFRLLAQDFGICGVRITLDKHIPIGAGLGGGSADAAYTLIGLCEHFGLNIAPQQLQQYALQLGSDVPFFLSNTPSYATGRGDVLEKIPLDLSNYQIEIIKPDIFVSTAEAYSGVTPKVPQHSILEILQQPVKSWRDSLHNDFEESVFAKHPVLAELKQSYYDRGALYAAMSGSGSAVFGIFEK
ncbi:MAG: 4-(cytidine 5'-diphospho)-2-C-methyl-D-erythritol kinase [Bacteroidales bacterium]|nr:4-(cytidine 5'-diphospho)-2-C-methyl-D-erythritol kinase [Bacteroidales bacterium]